MPINIELVVSINGGKPRVIEDSKDLKRFVRFIDDCMDYGVDINLLDSVKFECREVPTKPFIKHSTYYYILAALGHLSCTFHIMSLADKMMELGWSTKSNRRKNIRSALRNLLVRDISFQYTGDGNWVYSSKPSEPPKKMAYVRIMEALEQMKSGRAKVSELSDKMISLGWDTKSSSKQLQRIQVVHQLQIHPELFVRNEDGSWSLRK